MTKTRKTRTTYEQAIPVVNEYLGRIPTVTEVDNLYHEYRKNWKHYDGFTDWLMYYTA